MEYHKLHSGGHGPQNGGGLHILSRSEEVFANRSEAGIILGNELRKTCAYPLVVVGIPRGGIVVAYEIAKLLNADLDVVVTRKLGAPDNPELAIGSVGESGEVFVNEDFVRELGIHPDYIPLERDRQIKDISRRNRMLREVHPKVPLKGKIVAIVDDGTATGSTVYAAIKSVQQEKPRKIIVALPVGPKGALQILAKEADEIICLRAPRDFAAVSQYYMQFRQVEDEEVLRILREYKEKYNG